MDECVNRIDKGLSSTISIRSIAVFAILTTSSGGGSVDLHSRVQSTRNLLIGWKIVAILIGSVDP